MSSSWSGIVNEIEEEDCSSCNKNEWITPKFPSRCHCGAMVRMWEARKDGTKHRGSSSHRLRFSLYASDIISCSGKIIECSWNPEEKVWVFMRTRVDKSTPNEFNTYKKVMRSINDNITEEVVLNEIHEIVRLPMYADRIMKDRRTFIKTAQRK